MIGSMALILWQRQTGVRKGSIGNACKRKLVVLYVHGGLVLLLLGSMEVVGKGSVGNANWNLRCFGCMLLWGDRGE